ncbi:MAG: hypothetical protein ACTXOO_00335 [Sodalis sp. (in: enterobacteria)]
MQSEKLWVVDMDLRNLFNPVDRDMLMSRLVRKIKDKRLLKLIRRYLKAEIVRGKEAGLPVKGMRACCYR